MKITNKYGLPQTLVNVAERDDYSKGDARISVTGLLTPPRIAALRRIHYNKIEEDVSENIWPIMGRAIHKVLELGADEEHLSEERLYMDVDGWRVSGGVDLQKLGDGVAISDYKMTSAYSVMNDKPDWVAQLNSYAELIRQAKGYEVKGLSIVAIIRDWSRHRAKAEPDYPQTPVVVVPIELWPSAKARTFIEERTRLHRQAIAAHELGDELPPCSDEDRWMRGEAWAVKRQGNKRATKVFDIHTEAVAFAQSNPQFVIEHRPATPIRCLDYCNVAPWCAQFAAWKEENQ